MTKQVKKKPTSFNHTIVPLKEPDHQAAELCSHPKCWDFAKFQCEYDYTRVDMAQTLHAIRTYCPVHAEVYRARWISKSKPRKS